MWRACRICKATSRGASAVGIPFRPQHHLIQPRNSSLVRRRTSITATAALRSRTTTTTSSQPENKARPSPLPTRRYDRLNTVKRISTAIEETSSFGSASHQEVHDILGEGHTGSVETFNKALLQTLLNSQTLVPTPRSIRAGAHPTTCTTQPLPSVLDQSDKKNNPWLNYFATLGCSSVVEKAGEEWNDLSTVASEEECFLDYPLLPEQVDTVVSSADEFSSPAPPKKEPSIQRIRKALTFAIHRKDHRAAMAAYKNALQTGCVEEIHPDVLRSLFNLALRTSPFQAYNVLDQYRQRTAADQDNDMNAYADMYERVCDSLRCLSPSRHDVGDIQRLVRNIVTDMKDLDKSAKEKCYPVLVSALLDQRASKVGQFARLIYDQMVEMDFDFKPGYLEHLLSKSKYNRREDVPYPEILRRTVDSGRRPAPAMAINVLEHLFPYTALADTQTALKAILDLQAESRPDDERQYIVDIATLESIGAAAASRGSRALNLLVWDAIDLMGYDPTEAIYENTVMVFAASRDTYSNAFSVMGEIESRGFKITRALIRSISWRIRPSARNLDIAMDELKALRQGGFVISTGMLNAILSGCAERGDIDRVLSLFDEFSRNNIHPDADSYSFALEALGKHLGRRTQNPAGPDLITECLEHASSFLSMMEESGIAPTQHIIRDYVELLCRAGEVETATEVVLEESSKDKSIVNGKAIHCVAMANAKQGDYDTARKVASCCGQSMSYILESIEREYHRTGVTLLQEFEKDVIRARRPWSRSWTKTG